MRDLYQEASELGVLMAKMNGEVQRNGEPMTEAERALYWTARHAARQASDALLEEAKRLDLSEEQREALRKVAAEVAYD